MARDYVEVYEHLIAASGRGDIAPLAIGSEQPIITSEPRPWQTWRP